MLFLMEILKTPDNVSLIQKESVMATKDSLIIIKSTIKLVIILLLISGLVYLLAAVLVKDTNYDHSETYTGQDSNMVKQQVKPSDDQGLIILK